MGQSNLPVDHHCAPRVTSQQFQLVVIQLLVLPLGASICFFMTIDLALFSLEMDALANISSYTVDFMCDKFQKGLVAINFQYFSAILLTVTILLSLFGGQACKLLYVTIYQLSDLEFLESIQTHGPLDQSHLAFTFF